MARQQEGGSSVHATSRLDLVKRVVATSVDTGAPDYEGWFKKLGYSTSFTGADDNLIQSDLQDLWKEQFTPWRQAFMMESALSIESLTPEELYQSLELNDLCEDQGLENSSGEEDLGDDDADAEDDGTVMVPAEEEVQKSEENLQPEAIFEDLPASGTLKKQNDLYFSCVKFTGCASPRLTAVLQHYASIKEKECGVVAAPNLLDLPPLAPLADAPENAAETAENRAFCADFPRIGAPTVKRRCIKVEQVLVRQPRRPKTIESIDTVPVKPDAIVLKPIKQEQEEGQKLACFRCIYGLPYRHDLTDSCEFGQMNWIGH